MRIRITTVAVLTGGLLLCGASGQALEKTPVLSLEVAQKAAAACRALAAQKNWRMAVAVVDSGANTIVFERMDRSFLGSADIAVRKARASANFPFPTSAVGDLSLDKNGKPAPVPGFAWTPGVVTYGGGLPIMAGAVHIGGIGASGAAPEEDEQCAKAGLEAIKDLLK
ncbi:GlcG/HbpS family heme-binding protein [Methylibium sp.]|uniref:GlcG/HbpS family heme-binding protein n=1 Tax=Methylibium sp. TaxID=2067992 RepID=UPI003D148799